MHDDEYENSDEEDMEIINNEDMNLGEVDSLASATAPHRCCLALALTLIQIAIAS